MSAVTAEYELLENLDLDKAPPCEVTDCGKKCGKPAAARIEVTCRCGNAGSMFICQPHLDFHKAGRLECTSCHTDNFTWCEI